MGITNELINNYVVEEDQKLIEQIVSQNLSYDGEYFVQRLGGLTNHNYRVYGKKLDIVLRLPGEGTEGIVDRQVEKAVTQAASSIGIDNELLYFDPSTGVKAVQTVPNAQTMHIESMHDPANRSLAAKLLRKLHDEAAAVDFRFDVFEQIPIYERAIKENRKIDWEGYAEARQKVMGFQDRMSSIQLSLCHCDPLCENFVKDTVSNRMYLIDWEYGGMNDPLWDVADVCIEVGYDYEERIAFEQAYFGRPPTREENDRVIINMVLIDFLWALWGLQRSWFDHSLESYGPDRYKRACRNMALLDD